MTQQDITQQAASKPTHRIGGSILPSSDPYILLPQKGVHGTLQVRPLPEEDTYGLFLNEKQILAKKSNGYSCHALAERILLAWRGERDVAYALAQFDYILECGGEVMPRDAFEHIVRGMPDR